MPKIGPDDELGERMTPHVLSGGQCAAIRSRTIVEDDQARRASLDRMEYPPYKS